MLNHKLVLISLALVAFCSSAPVEDKESDVDVQATSEASRRKRAYSPWTGSLEEHQKYESFSVWKPPVYQLSRPYFVPIYGVPGRIPMYFPPQPINPYMGPPYLPPVKEEPGPSPTAQPTNPSLANRWMFDDDTDRPVWGTQPTVPVREPSFPPLVHNISKPGMHLSADSEADKVAMNIDDIFYRPGQFPHREVLKPSVTTTTTTTTTPRPSVSNAVKGPSNCVWAVISCCSASTDKVPESCFEQRGCPGPFWDASPCSSSFAKSALAAVMKYYENAKRA